ncbi:MAG TPA: autotransporter-associated beta strand repeat-containing protein [Chloroflexota bacterium]
MTSGAGTLTLGANPNTVAVVGTGATGATISGNLNLGVGQVFTIDDGAAAVDLTITGTISGAPGAELVKHGAGTLRLDGNTSNTYPGRTLITKGTLELAKTPGHKALVGPLTIGDDSGGANADVVRLFVGVQLADSVRVTVTSSGLLEANVSQTIGSLAGSGNVNVVSNGVLFLGPDNTSTTFSGVISGSGGGRLDKRGTGTLTLTGNNTYTGDTIVRAGTLVVNGSQPQSAITLAGGTLGGTRTVGAITTYGTGGTIAPGHSPGVLASGSVALGAANSLAVELDGTAVGTEYDQLNVAGTVSLGGAALNVSLSFTPLVGTLFTIVANDGAADAVTGTFAALPQGAVLAVSNQALQVSYTGGDGNDVTLRALGTRTPLPTRRARPPRRPRAPRRRGRPRPRRRSRARTSACRSRRAPARSRRRSPPATPAARVATTSSNRSSSRASRTRRSTWRPRR